MRIKLLFIFAALAVLSGCLTTKEPPSVVFNARSSRAFASTCKDPRNYWLDIVSTPTGALGVQGGFRLHRFQASLLPIEKSPVAFRPFVTVLSGSSHKHAALIDIASPECWSDYEQSRAMKMVTLGVRTAIPYAGSRDTGGVPTYLTLLPQMRLDQLFVENALFYTRLETRSLGQIARGITDPPVHLVLGWDLMRRFDQIRFDFAAKNIYLSAKEASGPNIDQLVGEANMQSVPGAGCVVQGSVAGKPQLFVLDPVGDFELVWPGHQASVGKQLGLGDLALGDVSISDEKVDGQLPRIGGRLLSKYTIVLYPHSKKVYFERSL